MSDAAGECFAAVARARFAGPCQTEKFAAQMLQPEEEQAIIAGTSQLDCSQITIRRRATGNPLTFSGPGWIRYDSDGDLIFKIVTPVGLGAWADVARMPPGKLVPDDRLYDLDAVDELGREWTARRVFVRLGLGNSIKGRVNRLVHVADTQAKHAHMRMVLPGRVDFPAHAVTETTTVVAGSTASESYDTNIAEFQALGHRVRLNKTSSLFVDIGLLDGNLDLRMDLLVGDALQFVLGRPMPGF